jgi:O-antigen ligase
MLTHRTFSFPNSLIFKSMLIFIFISVLSFLYAYAKGNLLKDIFSDFRSNIYLFLAYLPVASVIKNREEIEKIIPVLIVTAIIGAIWGIHRAVSGSIGGFVRLTSSNESIFGLMLLFSIIIVFFTKSKSVRILSLIGILFTFIAMAMSLARGTWLGFIAGFIFAVILIGIKYRPKKASAIFIATFTFGIILVLFISFRYGTVSISQLYQRFTTLTKLKFDPAAMARKSELQYVKDIFATKPIFGEGLGYTFIHKYLNRRPELFIHNSYLYFLTKMGLVGLISFLLILISTYYLGLKNIFITSYESQYVLIAALSMLTLLVVKCFTTYHFNTPSLNPLIGTIFGIIDFYSKENLKT